MKLCITEKPSVAKDIAGIVGASSRKDGYFEGNGYFVSWGFGHFCELEEPDFYDDKWKKWKIETLPMIPKKYEIRLKEDQGVLKQFHTIKKLLENATEVINCGDAGIEGELIQRWLLRKADYEKPHKRLWISSLTDNAIRKGFKNLKESAEFDNLFHAGFIRAIGDWLLGMNATRVYTLKPGNANVLLTIGRVQTPTLALIVERHKEILNFKPQTYWLVVTQYRETKFAHQKKKFATQADADNILAEIKNQPLTVSNIEGKEQKLLPPRLFDLTTLQVECNNHFGLSAANTLKIAQKLYENKLITYPRVDSQYLSNDMHGQIPDILKNISKSAVYQPFTKLIPASPKKESRYFNDNKVTDHHAIIPTGQTANRISPDEQKVFDLITRRFLAIFFPNAIEFKTKVTALVNQQPFFATGKLLKEPGWKMVYKTKEKKSKDEQDLPDFALSETGPHNPSLEKKETKPPKKYTEATLLRAMETCGKRVNDDALREALKENGIGRPSTRAAILENLFARKYLSREKKNIIPTELGVYLVDSIKNETLKSPVLTGEWENKLRKIEAGEFHAGRFARELNQYVTSIVAEVKNSREAGIQLPESIIQERRQAPVTNGIAPCPQCKIGTVAENDKAFGCSEWRNGCGFTIWKIIAKRQITLDEAKSLIKDGQTDLLTGFVSKKGNSFEATLVVDESFKVMMKFP